MGEGVDMGRTGSESVVRHDQELKKERTDGAYERPCRENDKSKRGRQYRVTSMRSAPDTRECWIDSMENSCIHICPVSTNALLQV